MITVADNQTRQIWEVPSNYFLCALDSVLMEVKYASSMYKGIALDFNEPISVNASFSFFHPKIWPALNKITKNSKKMPSEFSRQAERAFVKKLHMKSPRYQIINAAQVGGKLLAPAQRMASGLGPGSVPPSLLVGGAVSRLRLRLVYSRTEVDYIMISPDIVSRSIYSYSETLIPLQLTETAGAKQR